MKLRRNLFLASMFFSATAHAQSARVDPDQTISQLKRSPLYRGSGDAKSLPLRRIDKVTLPSGVHLDIAKYVEQTSLRREPGLDALFDPATRAGVAKGEPVYHEEVHELTDRLVVDRVLEIQLEKDACRPGKTHSPKASAAVDALCFGRTAGIVSPETKAHLQTLRTNLAAQAGRDVVPGLTAGQASKLSDEDLLELMLNGEGARRVRRVSVIPRLEPQDPTAMLRSPEGLVPAPVGTQKTMVLAAPLAGSPSTVSQDTSYFLTGFTLGRGFADQWEWQIAAQTFWHDAYYVRLSYDFGFHVGLRIPFSTTINAAPAAASDQRLVSMKAAPVDVAFNGSPAYPAVQLDSNEYLEGKEFVLSLKATCNFYASIPGKNVSVSCPQAANFDKGLNLVPTIGTDRTSLAEFWVKGKDIGLSLNAGAVWAAVDIGVGADMTNGKIGISVGALNANLTGLPGTEQWFSSSAPKTFTMGRGSAANPAGLRLYYPKYQFELQIVPKLRVAVGVNLAIYSHTWTTPSLPLEFLALGFTAELPAHAGTIAERSVYLIPGKGVDVSGAIAHVQTPSSGSVMKPAASLTPTVRDHRKQPPPGGGLTEGGLR